jgi:hypothetical protein
MCETINVLYHKLRYWTLAIVCTKQKGIGEMATERLFKVLDENGKSRNGGNATWSLPTQNSDGSWVPGDWMPEIKGNLVACENGYHLARSNDLTQWLNATIYEAEYQGDRVDADNKVVMRQVRLLRKMNWDDRVARLFACDCAERVLGIFEREYPGDNRPRECIAVARRYALGLASDTELAAAWVAARDAAWDAARSAARDAARAAETAWQTERLLWYLDGEQG